MAEPRRVSLIPVKSPLANGKLSPKAIDKSDSSNIPLKDCDKEQKTIRLEITLGDSTEKTSPEYSYHQLVKDKLKINGKLDLINKEDPLEEDDIDQLKALAKKFENKYGPKPGSNRKRKYNSNSLYVDIGYGYDDNDPFVDNSEAYDELVPADWTTQHGGFYINQGELHYRPLSDDMNDFKNTKKRKIGENKKIKLKEGEKNLSKTPKELSTQKRKKQLLNKEKKQKKLENALIEKEKKQKKKFIQSTKSPLSKTQKEKKVNSQLATKSMTDLSIPSSILANNDTLSHNSPKTSSLGSSSKSVIKVENLTIGKFESEGVSVNNEKLLARAQFVKDVLAKTAVEESKNTTSNFNERLSDVNEDTLQSVKESNKEGENSGPPQLPDNLPLILESGIQILKDAAANCSNGKCRFFDVSVNKTLLVVARALANLPCKMRTTVYDYLAYYLPCSKETLVKRAKTLMIEDQSNCLDKIVAKLKEVIERVMPEQKKLYDEAVANALTEQVREQMKQNGFPSKSQSGTSEAQEGSHDKEKGSSSELPMTPTEDKCKKNMPKRKFSWNAELRDLLCDVVGVKVKLFKMSKTRSMTAEEYIKDFLENDIRKLWPKGWMTSRILFKESKAAHQEITQPVDKVKKIAKKSSQSLNLGTQSNAPDYGLKLSLSSSSKSSNTVQNISDIKLASQLPVKTQAISKSVSNPNLTNSLAHLPTVIKGQGKGQMSGAKGEIVKAATLSVKSNLDPKTVGKLKSTSSKKEADKSYVTAVNPFERTLLSTGTSKPVVSLTELARNFKNSIEDRISSCDVKTIKTENIDQSIRNILDYATAHESPTVHKTTDKLARQKSHSKVEIKCTNANQSTSSSTVESLIHNKGMEADSDANSLMHGNISAVWDQKSFMSRESSYSTPYSTQLSHQTQVSKVIPSLQYSYPDKISQQLTSTKHTPSKNAKSHYKTPPKELPRSQTVTPPHTSPKTISPHRSGHSSSTDTSPLSRTSPLVHFPSGLEHCRRVSGHSPEEKRISSAAISHSVNRLTKETANKLPNFSTAQQADFSSMSFNRALSSLSNALAASSQQSAIFQPGHDQVQQKMAAMQQAKQITSTVDLLLQQQQQQQQKQVQQHLKQQAMLQQQQQHQQPPFPNISTSPVFRNQGPVRMGTSLVSPEVATHTNQNVLSSSLNTFDPMFFYQGSSLNTSEHFQNPFTNFRPKFS